MRRMYSLNQLEEIANARVKALVEGGTLSNAKPIYWHTIYFQRGGSAETSSFGRMFGTLLVLNNSPTPITLTSFIELLKTEGFVAIVFNGQFDSNGASNLENMSHVIQYITYNSGIDFRVIIRDKTTNVQSFEDLSLTQVAFASFEDLGANKIN